MREGEARTQLAYGLLSRFQFPFSSAYLHFDARVPFLVAGLVSALATAAIPLVASMSFYALLALRFIQVRVDTHIQVCGRCRWPDSIVLARARVMADRLSVSQSESSALSSLGDERAHIFHCLAS